VSSADSIDFKGRAVYIRDIEVQAQRMVRNVDRLLQAYTLPHDIVGLITHLEKPRSLDDFYQAYEERPFLKDARNCPCAADICRPECPL